jgi:peptide-methionine (R)-S-oxide reductase
MMEAVLDKLKEQITRRRALILTPFAFAGLIAISSRKGSSGEKTDANGDVTVVPFSDAGEKQAAVRLKRVVRTEAEWRKLLTAQQFYVTRKESTDTPFTGTYYRMHDRGLFRCVCCGTGLFLSGTKFDSGTGWPSFWAPAAEENIRTRHDTSMFMDRVAVECTLCGAHLGHLFDDGPPPTNLRYCINESSLRFVRS